MATTSEERRRVLIARLRRGVRRSREHREARQRALQEPDFFEEPPGMVHPIRDSPGYSPLIERQHERRRQQEEGYQAHEARRKVHEARESYIELQREILAEGGIRPNRDYPAEDIPRDVRRHGGKPPDVMAADLEGRGWHFEDAEDLLRHLRRRRRLLEALGHLQRA